MNYKLIFSFMVLVLMSLVFVLMINTSDNNNDLTDSYRVEMSKENYSPVIFPFSMGRVENLIEDGTEVLEGDKSVSLSLIYKGQMKKVFVAADMTGLFFNLFSRKNMFSYGEALGYVIAPTETGEIFFWVLDASMSNIQLGDEVILSVNEHSIHGIVSMMFGDYVKNRGQKIAIKLMQDRNFVFLIPHANMKKKK